MISLLVALAQNAVMGRENQLPWHLPEDLKQFKTLTMGKSIIMGRNTFDSIGKALPGRRNIVITRNHHWQTAGVEVVHSFPEALTLVKDEPEAFVIGGAEIFHLAWKHAQKLYLTFIDEKISGDVFFPFPDWQKEFQVLAQSAKMKSKSGLHYQFIEATRK